MQRRQTIVNSLNYEYTNDWFQTRAQKIWDALLPKINPARILEIGSYEGASACYLIEKIAAKKEIELHCIDTWEGGIEHREGMIDMSAVENRFHQNTALAIKKAPCQVDLIIHKGPSDIELSRLLATGRQGYFDFIYIDGSHQAPDVLCDAVLAYKLLKKNGYMVFDDYVWREKISAGFDLLRCPKPAIDAFTNIYFQKIRLISAPLYQLYLQKIDD